MKTDLVLMFAYHFPPENAIGGLRPFRFYKYLPNMGAECHVITAADVSTRPDLDAQYVPDPFETNPRTGLGWQIERALRRFVLPGVSGTQWALRAYRAGSKFIRSHQHARITIFSTYPPLGPHLAAFWLSRRTNVSWIADFRDPVADNPGSGELNWFQRAAYRWLERLFIRAADCVIANTDASQQRLIRLYLRQAQRIHLLWNGFDPEQRIIPLPVPDRKQRVFSHVGELYEGRSITSLLLSIGRLVESGRISSSEIQIQLVGAARSTSLPDPTFLTAATQAGWLQLIPTQIAQSEAQQIAQTSDGLLLVQPHSTLQVPGKLFEYIQIGRPILAFILPGSPIERILERSGVAYQAAYASDNAQTLDESVLKFFRLKTVANNPSPWFETEFNVQNHAELLWQMIQLLHRNK